MTSRAARRRCSVAGMQHAALAALLVLVTACGSSSKQASAPSNRTTGSGTRTGTGTGDAGGPATDCNDFDHQVELCQAGCDECSVSTPGNSCNVCAEACAQRVWCQSCGSTDGCDE